VTWGARTSAITAQPFPIILIRNQIAESGRCRHGTASAGGVVIEAGDDHATR
jgi:hypothetical protein